MLKRFRSQVGNAGLVIAVIALIAALAGGAYAASNGLNSTQKKQVKAIAKAEAKKYATAGPEGKQGQAGTDGKEGAEGKQGAEGKEGHEGKEGESVEIIPGEPASCAGAGGVTYEVAGSPTAVCNGKEGSPWTVGSVLPTGATETGSWVVEGSSADTEGVYAVISFPIQVKANITAANVIYVKLGETNAECTGGPSLPKAPEGKLCLYQSVMVPATESGPEATFAGPTGLSGVGNISRSGGLLKFTNIKDGFRSAGGWAYTSN